MRVPNSPDMRKADNRPAFRRARTLWHWLTKPASGVGSIEDARNSQLLILLTLGLTLLTSFGVISVLLSPTSGRSGLNSQITLAVIFGIAYIISRTRRYAWAASLVVGSIILLPLTSFVASGDYSDGNIINSLLWMPVALLFASIFFSRRGMIILVGLLLIGLSSIPQLIPEVTYESLFLAISLNFVVGVLTYIHKSHRDRLERDRQSELAEANRELQALSAVLESRVAERTEILALAAEVGRIISQEHDLPNLLATSVEMIRSRFDLYHVQVYLADGSQEFLTLRAGTGKVTERLLAQSHALPFGPGSINGLAAANRQAFVVPDTKTSPLFQPNPLLPSTRSEMVVPLMVGARVLGVLDLQSEKANGLTQDAVPAFEVLAGQLTTAIENARLITALSSARAELEAQSARQARTEWRDFLDAVHRREWMGFEHDGTVSRSLAEPLPEAEDDLTSVTPIAVQGQPVGFIRLEHDEDQTWTSEDMEVVSIVADQVAQQLENLRLLAESEQYRQEAEQVARRQVRDGWEAFLGSSGSESSGYTYAGTEVLPAVSSDGDDTEATSEYQLTVGDEPIGLLEIAGAAELDQESAELIAAVSERLTAHIEHLRLSQQTEQALAVTERQARRLAQLNRMSEDLNRAPALDDIYPIAAEHIGQILDSDWAFLTMIVPDNKATEIVAICGGAGDISVGDRMPIAPDSSVDAVIQKQRPVMVVGSQDEGPDDTGSLLIAPISGEKGVIGTIHLGSKEPNAFNKGDENIVLQVAAILGSAIERRELSEQMAKRAEELGTVARVSITTSTNLEMKKLLQDVVDQTKTSFDLYHVHIYMIDETGKNLRLAAGAGEIGQQMVEEGRSIPLHQDKSLVARAARRREAIIVNDVQDDPGFLPHPLLRDTRSEMAVPLIAGDEVLGVLDVQAVEVGRFTTEDIHIQMTLSAQVAIAIRNAQLFEEVQEAGALLSERVNQLNCLNDIGLKMEEAPSISEFLAWVAERIPPVMRYPEECGVAFTNGDEFIGTARATELPSQLVHELRVGNEIIGEFIIGYPEHRGYTDDEITLLGNIIRRVNNYVERFYLFAQTQEQLSDLAILQGTTSQLTVALTFDEAVQVLLPQIAKAVAADSVSFFVVEADSHVRRAGVYPVPSNGEASQPSELISLERYPLMQEVVASGTSLALTTDDPRLQDHAREAFKAAGVTANAQVPLIDGDQVLGLLSISTHQMNRAFNDHDVNLLHTLADQAMIAIQRVRLLEEARRKARYESILRQVTASVSRSADVDSVMRTAVEEVGRALGRRAFVYLSNRKTGPLTKSDNGA